MSEKDRVSFCLPSPCPSYQAVARPGSVQVAIFTTVYYCNGMYSALDGNATVRGNGDGSRILRDVDIAERAWK